MRTTNTFSGFPYKEIGIVFTPYIAPRVLVYRIIYVYIAKIRHGQQTGNIGAVHQNMIAEAVHLESINLPIFGRVIDGILT